MDVRENVSNVKRLIDGVELRHRIIAFATGMHSEVLPIDTVMMLLMQTPTVDAVPVVRCRECKYWGDEDGKLQDSDGVLFARCKVHNHLIDGRHTGWCPTENDFCSYGERKEGAT